MGFFLFLLRIRCPPTSSLFPYTTLFRSFNMLTGRRGAEEIKCLLNFEDNDFRHLLQDGQLCILADGAHLMTQLEDRKSTRLNSSHRCISYAVFCLKKKKK